MNSTTDPAGVVATIERTASSSAPAAKPLSIRVIGVGGAGGNAIDHMANGDLRELRLLTLHTNARILESARAPEKLLVGARMTHGLGAGGDPSLGRAAAEEDAALLKSCCENVDLLFIVAGLGGGTGTGVAPVLARVAREAGALVLGVVTLPFDLEGARRERQAQQGLRDLKAAADAVICLSNQKIFRMVDENTTVLESLKITNELLGQGIRGIWQMLTRPSLIHVDFADLCAAMRDRHAESSVASVEAQGEDRAREIVELLLACPLLDGGQVLAEAEAILVNLLGGPDLSMADIKRVMEEINRRTDNARLVMGASICEQLQGRLGVTLVACRSPQLESTGIPADRLARPEPGKCSLATPGREDHFFPGVPAVQDGRGFSTPGPDLDRPLTDGIQGSSRPGRPSNRFQQTQLALEIVSKGRFEKSEPTIHRGQDLDLPTYVRRGIPLN